MNICEPTPITTAVETSHVVGTEHTDGLRLVYLPKYCEPDAPEHSEDDASVYERFTRLAGADGRPASAEETSSTGPCSARRWSSRCTRCGRRRRDRAGVARRARASRSPRTRQIYPRLLNGDSVMGFAERVAGEAAEHLNLERAARPRPGGRLIRRRGTSSRRSVARKPSRTGPI